MSCARALGFALLIATACSDGQSDFASLDEPMRIRNAQFVKGPLPGTAPVSSAWMEGDPARVTFMSIAQGIVPQGFGGKKITGKVSTNATSTGLALKGLGTGWWLQPAGDIDTSGATPVLTLNATADFSDSLPLGPRSIVAVALDANGVAGPQLEKPICVASNGPAGSSNCPGGAPAPVAAITLTWDTQVDLDLQVMTPDGKLVTAKHPNIDDPPKSGAVDPNKPHFDRDSNPNCMIDGARRESLIWPTDPDDPEGSEAPSGLYLVYVNLFSACNQQAVRFRVQIMQAVPGPIDEDAGAAGASGEATPMVEQVLSDTSGELIAAQATPSAPTGMFVAQYDFE